MKTRPILCLLCLFLLLALSPAVGQVRRVAVLPFESDGLSPADVRALTLFFETALQNTKLCEIVEQTKVDAILKTHQFVLADFNDPEKAVAIGKLVPADTIALGTAGKLGSRPYVNIKLIELRTGTVIAARNTTAATVDALAGEMNALAAGMLGEPSREYSAPAAAPPTAGLSPASSTPLPRIARSRLALFESGQGIPPMESRDYAVSFLSAQTRFINWELSLEFAEPARQTGEYSLEAVFLRLDGSVLATQTMTARVEESWTWFRIENGWGSPNFYSWPAGTYTLNITMGGFPMGTTTFVVR